MRQIILYMALLALSGCNCGGSHTNANSGELSFSPDLQFGILGVGESVMKSATLKNVGSARVSVDSVQVAAPFSACIVQPDQSCAQVAVLDVGDSATVQVTYAPSAADASDDANDTAQLSVDNDSPTKPQVSIQLVGHAVAARLAVSPTTLDFGALAVGDSKSLTFALANKGVQDIVLSQPAISGGGVFATDLGQLSTTLARGGSLTATVTYAPTAGQDDSGALSFTTDVAVQSQVTISLSGHGEQAKVTLCFGLAGGAQTCLPDAQGQLAGALDFGVLEEGASQAATVTLASVGNVQVAVVGAAGGGATTADETALANPCGLSPAPADFAFVPAQLGPKLPNDPTAQDPNPPLQQAMTVTYTPSHHCPDDLSDRGVVSLKAGTGPAAPTFFLDLRGASKLGLAEPELVAWDTPQPTPVDYLVYNTGPGPLQVSAVELVEDDDLDCTVGCELRASCATSSKPECPLFTWDSGPQAATIAGAPSGDKTSASVGKVRYTPGALCGSGGVDGGSCFATPTVRVCTRVTSDDPFHPMVCGELKGRTF